MTWDWVAENARLNAENERRQEALRAEIRQREALDLQRRHTSAIERQSSGHSGIIGLLLFGLLIVGIVWAVMWFVGIVRRAAGRSRNSPTDQESALLALMRRHNVAPEIVHEAIRETLPKHYER